MVTGPAEPGFSRNGPEYHEALVRVRTWTRERFILADDAAIFVSEVACCAPGCPPFETVIVFWIGETRHHFKLFKPVRDVVLVDFPPAWLRDALVAPEGFECDCC
jgi:nitrate reductase delta subunit